MQHTLFPGLHSVRTMTSAAGSCCGVEPERSRTGLAIYSVWPLMSLHRSLTPLGNYLRRMKAKLGAQAATMATAHKIAVIFYTMIKNQVEYAETIWDARDAQREKRLEAKLKRQAKQLGFELVPVELKAA